MQPDVAHSHTREPARPRDVARSAATLLVVGSALALAAASPATALSSDQPSTPLRPAPSGASATLEQCLTSVVQGERSATFMGEMTAVSGTVRMAMRIDLQERLPDASEYQALGAGQGAWRWSSPRVKVYKYLRQVINLSAPDDYRALVRYRWIGANGRVIRRAERVTPTCSQPSLPLE
jgi:hypothetical protein